jgi:hypothetical protein
MRNTFQLRSESEASALWVFAGNGFGDAAIDRTKLPLLLSSGELYHLARAHRSYQLREIVGAALQTIGDFARRMITRWKHQQQS